MLVALLQLSPWCLVTISVLWLFLGVKGWSLVCDLLFPVRTHLLLNVQFKVGLNQSLI